MASLADLFHTIQQQAVDQYGGTSWWPAYQQAAAGGPDTLAAWLSTQAPSYSDWTPDAADFASKQLALQQDHTRNLFGVNVNQNTADRIGNVAAVGGKIGAATGLAGAAYLGAGALGAGASGAGEVGGSVGADTLAGSAGADTLSAGTAGAGATGLGGVAGAGAAGGETAGLGTAGYDASTGLYAGESSNAGAGTYGLGGGGATGAALPAAAGGGSVLSRIISGGGTTADYVNALGTLGAAGLGAYGSNEQANRLREIYNDMASKREPYRAKSLEYLNNPQAYAEGPGAATLDATLRRLSVGGNPVGDPAKLAIANSVALRDWRDAVTGFGNLGLAGEDTRANVAMNSANAANEVYGNLGYGIGALTRPPRRTLADYLGGLA